jgi:hypothetical protein
MGCHFVKRLCCEIVQVFEDIDVDTSALGPTEELDLPFDYDGVATTVVSGI